MNWIKSWILILMLALTAASVVGCGCGDDDDDDDSGSPGDDDSGDDDDDDDDTDDDTGDDDDDTDDDDVGPECVDADGDTYGENCEAGPDCNDNDANAFVIVTGYIDGDGDGYAGTGVDLCTNGTLPPEYLADADDCNDEDATVYPGATDFPDDGVDQDCDDADTVADEAAGFFVDTADGNDSNDGTKADPFETIQKGIDEAAADESMPNVYIAEGTYTEDAQVPVDGVVHLFGGYDPATWTREVKAPTVLEPDTVAMALLVNTGASVLVQGMTINGASSGDSYGIYGISDCRVDVVDSTIEAAAAAGVKAGVYVPGGSAVSVHRSTIDVGASSDDSTYGILAGYSQIAITDSQITNGGSPTDDAMGLYMLYSSGTVANTSITIGDADNAMGVMATIGALSFRDVTLETGEAVSQNFGLYTTTANIWWQGGSIAAGDAPTGSSVGVQSLGSSLMMDGAVVSTGDADALNVGAYVIGGIPGARAVLMNNIITTGDSAGNTFALYVAAIDSVVGQNVAIAGGGDSTRVGLFLTMSGGELANPLYFNNHFGSGPSSGDAYVALIPPGPPFRKVVFVGNNLDGNTDGLVYDGTNTLTDIDDVNACDFDSCGEAGGNLNEDPDFAGADDFHPNAGSPLIDAGVNPLPYLSASDEEWVWYDIGGSPRPVNGAWDIGAYEVD